MGVLEEHIKDEVFAGDSILMINYRDVQEMLTRVSVNAIARYESIREPKSDRMKQGEAKRYIVSRGFKAGDLKTWVEKGLIHADKKNDKQNGAVWYSKADIENVIVTIGMTQVMAKDVMYKKKYDLKEG